MAMTQAGAKAAILAVINSEMGPVPAGVDAAPITAGREKLAACIAAAVVYVKANGQVAAGIGVSTTGSAAAQTGATNTLGSLL